MTDFYGIHLKDIRTSYETLREIQKVFARLLRYRNPSDSEILTMIELNSKMDDICHYLQCALAVAKEDE